jgi:hypothetical protein
VRTCRPIALGVFMEAKQQDVEKSKRQLIPTC